MKVQLPWLNKASGRSLGTIYQSYWGNTYTRSMPSLFHYPDTPEQQATQATFFDIQRIWIPIYYELAKSIQRQQRKNKNPFNVMSSFIYRIFHPYKPGAQDRFPSNWGLDRLNRFRPVLRNAGLNVLEKEITLSFDQFRPYNDLGFTITTQHVLLFNVTRQSMLYTNTPLTAGQNICLFENTNDWKKTDEIVFYFALSCESWLGNFNRIDL